MGKYIQYGCGFSAPGGWTNYDASPTLRFERLPVIGKIYTRNTQRFPKNVKYGDIVKGLPEQPDSCDGVYCSYVLEHLAYNDFIKAIKNTYLVLKPGGLFRGVVPDLKAAALYYIENFDTEAAPANTFMQSTMLGIEERGNSVLSLAKNMFGNSKHLWMWDYKTLKYELENVGFKNVRPCVMGDSTDPNFLSVEEESRFYSAAAFECTK